MLIPRLMSGVVAGLACLVFTAGSSTAKAQSVEEAYDATLAAYNRTLNQLEECDERFAAFQKFAKEMRPPADATKEDWDNWAKAYRVWVDVFTGCMRSLKKEADDLKAKLDELQKQLDAISAGEEKEPPNKASKDKNQKAKDFSKKASTDLKVWKLNCEYKISRVNDWSGEASEQVREHGSGKVRIEPRFEFKF